VSGSSNHMIHPLHVLWRRHHPDAADDLHAVPMSTGSERQRSTATTWTRPIEAVGLFLRGHTVRTACPTALVVGSVLSMVNQGAVILEGFPRSAPGCGSASTTLFHSWSPAWVSCQPGALPTVLTTGPTDGPCRSTARASETLSRRQPLVSRQPGAATPRPILAVVTTTTGAAQAAGAAIRTRRLGSWRGTNQPDWSRWSCWFLPDQQGEADHSVSYSLLGQGGVTQHSVQVDPGREESIAGVWVS
jgi:hypothetical protein